MQPISVNLFLQLVRSCLWEKELVNFNLGQRFEEIMQLAKQQTLLGLVIKPMLDNNLIDDRGTVLSFIASLMAIQKRNEFVNYQMSQFCKFLNEHKVWYIVVKGQVAAQWYPDSSTRMSGDVDFLINKDEAATVEHLIANSFHAKLTKDIYEKHSEFTINNVLYEMHYDLVKFYVNKNREYWASLMKSEELDSMRVGETMVPTLSPTSSVLYVFIHLFFHLIESGVSLRQMCDWMMCLHANREKTDYQLLERHLRGLGLMKAYTSMGAIMVDKLGLPEKEFGFEISKLDRKRSKRILSDIIEMGNFGRNKHLINRVGFMHSIQTGFRVANQSLKFWYLAPKEIGARWPHMVLRYVSVKVNNKIQNVKK